MGKVIVIGGGAAGMMAAVVSARGGNTVTLLEQNEKLGKKLFITGKGRCNLTNHCDAQELLEHVITNRKFLYSAFYEFDADSCMDFFEQLGVRLKVERGNRVFPASDHSSDIIRALEYELRRLGVTIMLGTRAADLLIRELNDGAQRICGGVLLQDGRRLDADAVILATGGVSYPLTGADGSGIRMAQRAGIASAPLYPALVPLRTREAWGHALMGLSLKNVEVSVKQGSKCLYQGFGEMLFTHNGVSGPLILSASSLLTKKLQDGEMTLLIDLKPALSEEQLDRRLLRDFEKLQNKTLKSVMAGLLPARLAEPLLQQASVAQEQKVHTVSKAQRRAILYALKHLQLTVTGTGDFSEAIITQGGISVREINPSTMEAKAVRGLFLAGECMDLDALTGGYNLQIAWTTGYLAGMHAGVDGSSIENGR